MEISKAVKNIQVVFDLYDRFGGEDYMDGAVTQLDHMFQTAKRAEGEGYNEEIILSAFFHDIGHLISYTFKASNSNGECSIDYGKVGAEYLQGLGFSENICNMVRSQLQTKRYLNYKFYNCDQNRSSASIVNPEQKETVMNAVEARVFECNPMHLLYIKLLEWDNMAIIGNVAGASTAKYQQMALKHLLNQDITANRAICY